MFLTGEALEALSTEQYMRFSKNWKALCPFGSTSTIFKATLVRVERKNGYAEQVGYANPLSFPAFALDERSGARMQYVQKLGSMPSSI